MFTRIMTEWNKQDQAHVQSFDHNKGEKCLQHAQTFDHTVNLHYCNVFGTLLSDGGDSRGETYGTSNIKLLQIMLIVIC